MIYTETKEYDLKGPEQQLPGFEPRYTNIVDYILSITEEIWEEMNVGLINATYAKEILVHSGRQKITGVEKVVQGTLATLASFPDRKMGGEAVIWSEFEKGHFYTSHRIASAATNLGPTPYGEATGKRVFFRTIADCMITENKIYEEWLVRDNLHLLQQLGFDPIAMAKRDRRYANVHLGIAKESGAIPSGGDLKDLHPNIQCVQTLFQELWADRDLGKVPRFYHSSARVHAICATELEGHGAIRDYFSGFLALFSDVGISVERITSNVKGEGHRVAVRWRMTGTHTGEGFLGNPSGKSVVIPIINHYEVKDGKIQEEWMVFDGFDTLCQIHAQ